MEKVHVCACVIRQGENILICGRKKGTSLEGFFEFPGGKFEKGETLALASGRELMEELGVKVFTLDEIGHAQISGNGKLYCIHFVRTFLCPGEKEKLGSIGREGQEIKWIKTSLLPEYNLLPSDLDFARFLLSGIQ